MIRVAAVGDVHVGEEVDEGLRRDLATLGECADVLLLAGDLTRHGTVAETRCLTAVLDTVDVPIVAVLGNHDHHSDEVDGVVSELEGAGVEVLEGTSTTVEVGAATLGIAGAKGFGGGFVGASASEFGEPEMKSFVRHTRDVADRLRSALQDLRADRRIALLHYSPIEDTLHGERLEIYPFLGSYLLAEAVDQGGADLVLHGHAHAGSERGVTPGGIRVRNVARPLIQRSFRLFELDEPSPAASAAS
ncbi:MAG TPA: metallophosphoesterase [Acidimicrobiales bacterium]